MLAISTGIPQEKIQLPGNVRTCIDEGTRNTQTAHLIPHIEKRVRVLSKGKLDALSVILNCDEMKDLHTPGYTMLATAMGVLDGTTHLSGPLQYIPSSN